MLSRRAFLQWALSVSLSATAWAEGMPPADQGESRLVRPAEVAMPRVAILDWGLTEMALTLGIVPVGIAAPDWYRRLFAAPVLPSRVQDVGLLFQPNFETLKALNLDAIIITPAHGLLRDALTGIAPLVTLGDWGGRPLAKIERDTRLMARTFGREAEAAVLLAQSAQRLAQARAQLAPLRGTEVFLATVADVLHLQLQTSGGLFDDVTGRLGLKNAWRGGGNGWGEALVELQQIAAAKQARLVSLGKTGGVPPEADTPLWRSLPLTQRNNIVPMPAGLSSTGALLTAVRFAEALAAGLSRAGELRHV
ncbi:ABC transporter substrate-binding protein [Acerihabitans sp. KWT182]|uniref:ABC transporter substrate-binding protein n=1 Tax=Acerihabitans sp. KWT182 TaxID=3157919 RepID=A0AAU7Q9U3_9GAMM